MAFTTRYDGQIVIADAPEDMVFGTAMLGNVYGEVLSASIIREADVNEVIAAGSLRAAILQNPKFQFEFEVMFRESVEAPGFAELIEFPLAGISGRVMPPISIKWAEGQHRSLAIKATSWDHLAENDGAGQAYTFDGTNYVQISDA
jgi:hypothetical protein